MDTLTSIYKAPDIRFGEAGWISKNPLPRDQKQSLRLHEPTSMISSIDPINGHDVMAGTIHPSVIDGILTIYFESEETRTSYVETPLNHPFIRLSGEPSDEDDRAVEASP